MALETGNFINDLVITNPVGSTDQRRTLDDHIRLIKKTLKQTLVGFSGAVVVSGTDGGSANAYTVTPTTALPSYAANMCVIFTPAANNTGASTINISGLGAKDIKSVDGVALVASDLVAGSIYVAIYNGTEFRLIAPTKNYADQLAFGTALPNQTGNIDKIPTTDGSSTSWTALLKTGTIRFADSTDTTKQLAFDVSGVTAGQTRTATVPDYSGTLGLRAKGPDIASAATVNLDTATGDFVHITGTTTITAITLASSIERTVVFDGALILTHNATTLILPGGANITTAAGDRATFRGDGTGNVRCIHYTRASAAVTASGLTQATAKLLGRTTAGTGAIEEIAVSGATLSAGTLTITPPSAATGASLTLLATLTPTAAANVDALNVFSSSYDNYLIIGDGLLPAADDVLRLRFANAGSADSGSKYYTSSPESTTANTSSETSSRVTANNVIALGLGCNFALTISNANDAVNLKSLAGKAVWQSAATPGYIMAGAHCAYSGANSISGVRFFWNGGNNFAATGKIRIYGYNNS